MNLVFDNVDVQCPKPTANWITVEECKLDYTLRERTPDENKIDYTNNQATRIAIFGGALILTVLFFAVNYCEVSRRQYGDQTVLVINPVAEEDVDETADESEPERERSPVRPNADAERACIICLENEKTYANNFCGHLCYCASCFDKRDNRNNACPVCRNKKGRWLRIFT